MNMPNKKEVMNYKAAKLNFKVICFIPSVSFLNFCKKKKKALNISVLITVPH